MRVVPIINLLLVKVRTIPNYKLIFLGCLDRYDEYIVIDFGLMLVDCNICAQQVIFIKQLKTGRNATFHRGSYVTGLCRYVLLCDIFMASTSSTEVNILFKMSSNKVKV